MNTSVIFLTSNWRREQTAERRGRLHQRPGPTEVAGPHALERVDLDGVAVAAEQDAVEPGEEHVAVVALDDGQRQQTDSCSGRTCCQMSGPTYTTSRLMGRVGARWAVVLESPHEACSRGLRIGFPEGCGGVSH